MVRFTSFRGETAIDREVSRQEAFKAVKKFAEREKKERIKQLKTIQIEEIRAKREIKKEIKQRIELRKKKIKKLRGGLSRKFGKSFEKIGKAIRKKRIQTLKITVQKKKRSAIVGTLEKRQEEKSVFFK